MSGRREPQVHELARLMGQRSYIYEAGCAFAIEGETTLLTGEMAPDEDGTVYEQIEARGIPRALFEHFEGRLDTTRPGTTAASSPTSSAARSTSPRPTRCSASDGDDDLRLLDNGAIGTPMAAVEGRPTPTTWSRSMVSKAAAVAAHARARGYDPRRVHRRR